MMMKNKRNIYCEYQFWEGFFEMEDEVSRNRAKRMIWDAFHHFLSNNTIFFNIPKEAINSESKGGIRINELFHEKGGASVNFDFKDFPKIESFSNTDDKYLNSIFLTMEETTCCKDLSERFGVIVFNLEMIFFASHVFMETKVPFDCENNQNWGYLMKLKDQCPSISCCNSLLLVDRYLLSEGRDNIFHSNLMPIFDALLPQYLDNNIKFTICVLAEKKDPIIEEKVFELEDLVKSLRPKLNFILNVFNSWLHDRAILTNNIILVSGAGFDVIGLDDKPMRMTTTSLYFPFLQFNSNENNTYLTWINNVLKRKSRCLSYRENYWGDKATSHHLLDYYNVIKPRSRYWDKSLSHANFASISQTNVGSRNNQVTTGIYHKSQTEKLDVIIQHQKGFHQEVRGIRKGELINDGDEVEYELHSEQNPKNPSKKFWYALDVHLRK